MRRPMTAVGSGTGGAMAVTGRNPSEAFPGVRRSRDRAVAPVTPSVDGCDRPLRSDPMSDVTPDPGLFDRIVNLTKRRGFVFPSAEIYGGFRSTYDYGPIGVLMLRNVKDAWWRSMVQLRDDVVGLDAAILSPPAIWEASGHLATFTDPLVDC